MNFENLIITFPISGVETFIFIPPLVAFVISFFTSMAGISGAFLILPFQVSLLGFTTPSVNSTNFLYNVVGTPAGVFRYTFEKRMVWPIAAIIVISSMPGVLLGYFIRIRYLPDPKTFKFFIGLLLLFIGIRIVKDLFSRNSENNIHKKKGFIVTRISYSLKRVEFDFIGEKIAFSIPALACFSAGVGIISGIYGIGGGAILAPFCVSVLGIPIYTVAGAILFANFFTSLSGMIFYSTIPLNNGLTSPPDWLLGVLFGIGGIAGMYSGAKCQKYIPEKIVKLIMVFIVLTVSTKYILKYFT